MINIPVLAAPTTIIGRGFVGGRGKAAMWLVVASVSCSRRLEAAALRMRDEMTIDLNSNERSIFESFKGEQLTLCLMKATIQAEGESPPRQHTRKRSLPEPREPRAKRRAGNGAAVAAENAAVAVSMQGCANG